MQIFYSIYSNICTLECIGGMSNSFLLAAVWFNDRSFWVSNENVGLKGSEWKKKQRCVCDLIWCHLRFLDGSSKRVISWNVRILMSPWATSPVLTQRVGKSAPLLAESLHQCDISGWLIPRPLWRRNPPNLPPPTSKTLICVPSDGWGAPLWWIQIKNRRWGRQKKERERTFTEKKIKSDTARDDVPVVNVRSGYTAGGPPQAAVSRSLVHLLGWLWTAWPGREGGRSLNELLFPTSTPCDTGGRRQDRSPRVSQTVLS